MIFEKYEDSSCVPSLHSFISSCDRFSIFWTVHLYLRRLNYLKYLQQFLNRSLYLQAYRLLLQHTLVEVEGSKVRLNVSWKISPSLTAVKSVQITEIKLKVRN